MKRVTAVLVCSLSLMAQGSQPAPAAGKTAASEKKSAPSGVKLPEEIVLRLQILVQQERDASQKVQAIVDLAVTPLREARQAAMEDACRRAGILVEGKPMCDVNLKDGTAHPTAKDK